MRRRDVIYEVLGELQIREPRGGQPLPLPTGVQLKVLAALLVQPNKRLPHAELLRMAWGTPHVQEAQLHKAISALRRRVGRPDDIVTHTRFGYELRVADDELDLLAFEKLTVAADAAGQRHRPGEEAGLLDRALRLWRGPRPLANVPGPVFATVAHGLQERRKRVAVRLFTLRVQRGEFAGMLGDLQRVTNEFATDHQLHRLLMVALYRSGHRAEAIEVYERYAQALQAEIGEPDAELRMLKYAIGRGDDDGVSKALPLPEQPVRGASAVPRQLPAAPPDFVGREPLLAELVWLLRAGSPYRIMVVPGLGGIGKTALALQAAHRRLAVYPDGQLWAELRGASADPADPGEILAQFLRALDAPVIPESTAERGALFRTLVADRRMLMVLDDAGSAAQIRPLIPAGDGCRVLVTTRRHLPDVQGAHHVGTLEPLGDDDAATLFASIVAASRIDLDGEQDAIRDVIGLCGGLPLALRVVAALRVHDHPRPTAELARRLRAQGPAAYAFGDASLARTLEAGLAPLEPAHRRLFTDLGLLPLPAFGVWTAVALTGDAAQARAGLAELAAASMVETTTAPLRYRFHDLTREYAYRRALAERPDPAERDALLARVCTALLTLARRAHRGLYGGDFEVVHSEIPDAVLPAEAYAEVDADPIGWFRAERLSLRAAVEVAAQLGHAALAWDLAVSAHEFYTLRSEHDDWLTTHLTALRACRAAGDGRGEGIVLACLGQPSLVAGGRRDGVSGIAELGRAVELLAAAGDRHGLAIARRTLANALRRRGRSARALVLFEQALGGYEDAGDLVGQCQTLRFIGQVHLDRGDHKPAAEVLARAEQVAADLGRPLLIAQTRYWTGYSCLAVGDLTAAALAFSRVREVLGPDRGVGYGYALHGLGDLALHRHELDDARAHLGLAVAVAHEHADALLEGRIHLSLADLWQDEGRAGEHLAELRRAARCFADCDAAYLEVPAQARLAGAEAAAGSAEAAASAWARVDHLYATGEVPEQDRTARRP
ncbi:SARP family transcriptional regulator [Winogradskya consettensis]|uniref:SARP family transcriptional regulator n=1 Tax=Winogradskya consettensis TaxID=113560 RepID=A0A919SD06_9ACTN|nr:SARP family transcriptional regulator [Actinoplanes consettensis]